MNNIKLRHMLENFFIEDIGEQDLTSEAIFPGNRRGTGQFIMKQDGVLAGLDIITEAYRILNPEIKVSLNKRDGDEVSKGDIIAETEGPMGQLLTGERLVLNLLQRMSGIATLTNEAVTRLDSSHTRICDTRKTTPGLRMLEKYAVKCGGGYNHRFGLYDGVMIKDNHIAFSGSITKAVEQVRKNIGHMVKIEVETETREQVLEAVNAGVDVIMFDNRSPEEVKSFAGIVPKPIVTEASGGITLENLAEYGKSGVDYISLGMLTHSARSLDISFLV